MSWDNFFTQIDPRRRNTRHLVIFVCNRWHCVWVVWQNLVLCPSFLGFVGFHPPIPPRLRFFFHLPPLPPIPCATSRQAWLSVHHVMAPLDRDERMGPPSLPTPASVGQNQSQPPQETIEKYKKLKRRYAELQEVRVHIIMFLDQKRRSVLNQRHQESNTDSNQSDDRNVRMREEKECVFFSFLLCFERVSH